MNDEIIKRARRLARRCGTKDPFRIAKEVGIELDYTDLGKLKGMYACIQRNRFIVINNALDDYTRRLVCAHELGHDQFHRALATDSWMQEFMIYNMNARPEYEANIFASELLLPDDEILQLTDEGLDIAQIAQVLCSDVNLVALKLATLRQQGYQFRMFEFRDDFLR
ncbi:MAG: ImmA/IrrE family metallo-endopeptidase [Oscillospiraceae bacterium]|jgi:Zn-dependent peptidase ImmA (M78 family)|nr:ImmA/IrrE family metallo-endopeptidase [Oscillospiraceae bacterium]